MRFRKIQLQNFRSHVDTTLDLDRLTVIRGTNAAGKSSLEQAIEITLASRADGTTSDGKGSVNLIRAGSAKSLITLAAQQDGEERILRCALNDTKRTVVVGKPGDPQYAGGEEWMEWLGLHKEVLSCLINNRHFVNLKPDEQKDVLASIILPKTYEWPSWVMPICHDLGLKINWAKTPFEIIDTAYDLAFKARTDVNRDFKNFKLPEGDTAGADQLEDLSHRLGARRQELDDAKKRKYELEGAIRSNVQLLTAAQERLAGANARLSREQQEIPGIESRLLSPAKLKELEKVAKNLKRAQEIDAQIAQYDAQIEVHKVSLKKLNDLSSQPACPTCQTLLTDDVIATLANGYTEQRRHTESLRDGSIATRKGLGDPGAAELAISAHAKATTDMERAKARVKEEQTAIADAEAKIAELEAAAKQQDASAIAEVDKLIVELNAKVERGNGAVAAARAAKELAGRIEAAQGDRAALQKRQVALEKLVKYFGTEVKAELLAASIGSFTQAMNEVLAQWGYICELSIEPYVFAVIYRDSDNKQHPISLGNLSKSERYRFSVAFQVALAVFTGFKFVIVDEADIFDAKGRGGLFAALNSGQLDQAIVLSTDERETVPAVEGAVFYQFSDASLPGMIPTTTVRRLMPAATVAA